MKKTETSKIQSEDGQSRRFKSIYDSFLTPEQAAVERLRAGLLTSLRSAVNSWEGGQRAKAKRLGITQSRLAILLNTSAYGKYSLDNLVTLVVRAGVEPPVFAVPKVSKPKAEPAVTVRKTKTSHRELAHA